MVDVHSPGEKVSVTRDGILVPQSLLKEIVSDGCCPLHLRLQLSRLLGDRVQHQSQDHAGEASETDTVSNLGELAPTTGPCLAAVTAYLPLAEVLATRACGREALQWAMQRGVEELHGPRHWIHNRIRARLWIRRVQDITEGSNDETVFNTKLKQMADRELKARMESEMQQALTQWEQQISTFQVEIDRRLLEQEQHVRQMVDQRVQEKLDTILGAERAKVAAMVEERVRERVSAIFRREIHATLKELQERLDRIADENEVYRDAFAEANLRAKSAFWALRPALCGSLNALGLGLGPSMVLDPRRRLEIACSWSLDADWARMARLAGRPQARRTA